MWHAAMPNGVVQHRLCRTWGLPTTHPRVAGVHGMCASLYRGRPRSEAAAKVRKFSKGWVDKSIGV